MKTVKIIDDGKPILIGDLARVIDFGDDVGIVTGEESNWIHGGEGDICIVTGIDEWWIHVVSIFTQHKYCVAIEHDPDLQKQYGLAHAFQRLRDQKKEIDMSIDTSHKDKWIQTFKDIEEQCSKPLPIWNHHAIKWRATLKPSEITSFVKIAKQHQKRHPKRWYHKVGQFLSFTKST